jgi:hypothetical protein
VLCELTMQLTQRKSPFIHLYFTKGGNRGFFLIGF